MSVPSLWSPDDRFATGVSRSNLGNQLFYPKPGSFPADCHTSVHAALQDGDSIASQRLYFIIWTYQTVRTYLTSEERFPRCYLSPLLLVLFPQTLKTVHFFQQLHCHFSILTPGWNTFRFSMDFLNRFPCLLNLHCCPSCLFHSDSSLPPGSLLAQVSQGAVLQAPRNKHNCPPQHKLWGLLCCSTTVSLIRLVCDQLWSQATEWLFR